MTSASRKTTCSRRGLCFRSSERSDKEKAQEVLAKEMSSSQEETSQGEAVRDTLVPWTLKKVIVAKKSCSRRVKNTTASGRKCQDGGGRNDIDEDVECLERLSDILGLRARLEERRAEFQQVCKQLQDRKSVGIRLKYAFKSCGNTCPRCTGRR